MVRLTNLLLAAALGGGVCLWAQAPKEDAAAIYKRQCAGCHGPDAKGQTAVGKNLKVPDLTSAAAQHLTDSQLFDDIAKGKGKMPAYENNLGHDRIQELVAYLRQFGKGPAGKKK